MKKSIQTIPLTDLQLNAGQISWLPKNPRQWTKKQMAKMIASLDEDPDFMEDRPPLVVPAEDGSGAFVVFGGNERTQGEKERKKVTALRCVVYEPEADEDYEIVIRRAIKDNGHYADDDTDILANEWDKYLDKFEAWGKVLPNAREMKNSYSRLIAAPEYKPRGEVIESPAVLYDNTKVDALKAEIEASGVTGEVRDFLMAAAERHRKFDFANIAEYYAQAPEEVKRLMESSALVIVDFGKAISGGFVDLSIKLEEALNDQKKGGKSEEDEEDGEEDGEE